MLFLEINPFGAVAGVLTFIFAVGPVAITAAAFVISAWTAYQHYYAVPRRRAKKAAKKAAKRQRKIALIREAVGFNEDL